MHAYTHTHTHTLLLPRPAGLGRRTGTLFFVNLAVFSMLFWNFMFLCIIYLFTLNWNQCYLADYKYNLSITCELFIQYCFQIISWIKLDKKPLS